ncbi:MAG: ABC transporter permease, partial [Fervidobacterium sp.]
MSEEKKKIQNMQNLQKEEKEENVPVDESGNIDFEEVYLTRGQLMWRAFRKNKLAMFGMWVLIVMYIAMIFADFLAPYNPFTQNLNHSLKKPTTVLSKYEVSDLKLRMAPYVLPEVSYIDSLDYTQNFRSMLFPSRIKFKFYDGKELTVIDKSVVLIKDDGTVVPKYLPKGRTLDGQFVLANGIKFVVRTIKSAKIDGEWKEYSDETSDMEALVFGVDEDILKKGKNVRITTSRTARSFVAQNEGWKMGFYAMDEQEAMERLTEIKVEQELAGIKYYDEDFNEYEISINEAKIVSYDYKFYPVKFFIKSWGPDKTDPERVGYLLGIIPLHY